MRDEVAAWCFDRAVFLFGTELDAELSAAAKGAKNDNQARQRQARVLAAWGLGEVQYRDPAAGGTAVKQGTDSKTDQEKTISSETATGPVSL